MARQTAEKALELDPHFDEAQATFLRALARDPRDYLETTNIAFRFHYLHEFENAEGDYAGDLSEAAGRLAPYCQTCPRGAAFPRNLKPSASVIFIVLLTER